MSRQKTNTEGHSKATTGRGKAQFHKAIKTTFAGTVEGHRAGKAIPKSKVLAVTSSEIVARVRKSYGIGRRQFARITGFSERAIGGWEHGGKVTEPGLRKMREMDHLYKALAEIMQADFIPDWLETPNEEFRGAKPIEVIERGEIGDIWRFIFYLESGMPV